MSWCGPSPLLLLHCFFLRFLDMQQLHNPYGITILSVFCFGCFFKCELISNTTAVTHYPQNETWWWQHCDREMFFFAAEVGGKFSEEEERKIMKNAPLQSLRQLNCWDRTERWPLHTGSYSHTASKTTFHHKCSDRASILLFTHGPHATEQSWSSFEKEGRFFQL